MRSISLGFLLALISALTACVDNEDYAIEVKKIEKVNFEVMKDSTGESIPWLQSHTGGDYLRITINVSSRLVKYVYDNDVNVSIHYDFCEGSELQSWIGLPSLYHSGKSLTDLIIDRELNEFDIGSSESFEFEMLLFGRWDGKQDEIHSGTLTHQFVSYDLISNPVDVCFIVQASGFISGVKSEVVKIPKDKFILN